MTSAELDELERLANAATPGPWVLVTSRVGPASPHHAPRVDHAVMSNGGPIVAFGLHSQRADPRLIAAAREAIPKLIARVRELEELAASRYVCWSCLGPVAFRGLPGQGSK